MSDTLQALKETKRSGTATPRCPYFGECGGCSFQDMAYEDQLSLKEEGVRKMLGETLDIQPGVFKPIVGSPKRYHYRHRIDLRLQCTRNGIFIGYTPASGRGMLPVDSCAIAYESIDKSIPTIKKEALEKLPDKYRRANLTVRASLDGRVVWGGIGKGSLRMKEKDYLSTRIDGKKIYYAMETFFQANLSILPLLINRLRGFPFLDKDTHFYDLYAGVGLFGVSLADQVKGVLLIEAVPQSITLAQYNIRQNNVTNARLLEGPIEEYLETINKGKKEYKKVAMIDPPRAGLSEKARHRLAAMNTFSHCIYLSCNPQALARDLEVFVKDGWRLTNVIPFDFFPQTRHIETLVVMEKR